MKSQRPYVEHVIGCIRRIVEDSASGRDAVFASRTLQDAIVRNLQVLCESTQRIDTPHKQRHPEIDWRSIAGMRNVLVHDYFEVDFETVWLVVTRTFLPLKKRGTEYSSALAWLVIWHRITSSPLSAAKTSAGRRFAWLKSEKGKLRTTTSPFTNWPRLRPPRKRANP